MTSQPMHNTPTTKNKIGQNVFLSDDTSIGEGVSIGNNVTIYPGVTIGDNTTIFDGAVIGRPPLATSSTNRPVDSTIQEVKIGAGCVIGANAVLYTGITIGNQVLIGDLASIREGCEFADQVVIGRGVLVMYNTFVGAHTRVIDGAILTGEMFIDEDVFIGPGVNTINDNNVYTMRFGLIPFEVHGPIIERFALIGTGAHLAAGIKIGMGAIVAPNAMVTRDVPPWTKVAGVPARDMGMVDPEIRQQILQRFNLDSELTNE